MEKPENRIFSEWERQFDNMPGGTTWEKRHTFRGTGANGAPEAAFMFE